MKNEKQPACEKGSRGARRNPLADGPLAIETREPWAERFGREAPIEVEIGFGYGHFILEYASSRPHLNLVGFEVRAAFVSRVAARIERLGLRNVAVLRGDARRLLPVLFGPESIRAVHIQFPDPWWKKRHHRRRLVNPPFVTLLHRLVEPGGLVYLRTDVLAYGREMLATFEDGSGRFENTEGAGTFAAHDPLGVTSNRERHYLASGDPVHRLTYRRS